MVVHLGLFSGTNDSNVICKPCPDGTFSDKVSYTDPCRPHTRWPKISRIPVQQFQPLSSLTTLSLSLLQAVLEGLLGEATALQTPCVDLRLLCPTRSLCPQKKSLPLELDPHTQVQWWPQGLWMDIGPQTPHCLSAYLFQRHPSTTQQRAHHQTQYLTANWVR